MALFNSQALMVLEICVFKVKKKQGIFLGKFPPINEMSKSGDKIFDF